MVYMLLRKRKISRSQFELIGSFLLALVGLIVLGYNYYEKSSLKIHEEEQIESFFEEEDIITESIDTKEVQEEPAKKEKKVDYNYIGVLEIESIGLKRGFVNPNSKYNYVNYNIQIIETSTMPDVDKGNFIVAGHNGNSYISFFKNLHKMNSDDLINIYYNGYKYVYKYDNFYEVEKTGTVNIVRDKNKTAVTLITCKRNSNKQLVFIGYLIDKVEY